MASLHCLLSFMWWLSWFLAWVVFSCGSYLRSDWSLMKCSKRARWPWMFSLLPVPTSPSPGGEGTALRYLIAGGGVEVQFPCMGHTHLPGGSGVASSPCCVAQVRCETSSLVDPADPWHQHGVGRALGRVARSFLSHGRRPHSAVGVLCCGLVLCS